MEYRHIMEAYFKMMYIKSYHELVNSHDGVDITIHKRNNALKAEKELKDNYNIEYKEGRFIGQINHVDAEVLFHNMSAQPECIEIKNKLDERNKQTIIKVESKDDIKLLDTEKE